MDTLIGQKTPAPASAGGPAAVLGRHHVLAGEVVHGFARGRELGFPTANLETDVQGMIPADGVYARLKFEGGVHRVQRVPVTESQGRIHTSAAGVLVLPEVDAPDEVHLDPNDLKVDVFRSSGPGGQSVNTTDSAVRLTHLPTGIVVSMQNEKSQIQNREAALRVLRSRLLERQRAEQDAENSAARAAQVRTMDRSERIRTYNFPENRISDHRTGFKANRLDAVLDGDLDAVVGTHRRRQLLGGGARIRYVDPDHVLPALRQGRCVTGGDLRGAVRSRRRRRGRGRRGRRAHRRRPGRLTRVPLRP